jgi:hypothetical protein
MEKEFTPVATVTGLYRGVPGGFEPLDADNPLLLHGGVQRSPVFYEMELFPEHEDEDIIVDLIYDNMRPIRLQDLMRGTDIPYGFRFWPDWFEIPLLSGVRDADGYRVYPRAPGIHTVRIKTAIRRRDHRGPLRDFSPANGGATSPIFEFAIVNEVNDGSR